MNMLALTYILYAMYIIFVFYYFARIYGVPMISKIRLPFVILINTFLVYVPIHITDFNAEWLMMIIYFVVLGLQIALTYKQTFVQTIAAVLCFTINYFGVRVLLIGIFAYNSGQQVPEMLSVLDNRIKITAITFLILAPYILVSSRILISKVVRFLFADIASLKLCCVLLGTVTISQFLALPTLSLRTKEPCLNSMFQIKISVVALVAFVLIMTIVFIYSKLKQASITYESTFAKIKTDNSTITELEAEAKTDFFTGFYVRSIAVNKLQEFLNARTYCYLVYLDLDGLKHVNDTFGHEEGDWYIKTVAKEIKRSFSQDTIARIGGDEFLIIGNFQDPLTITQKVEQCYKNILSLSNAHDKNYETSISYGITEVDSGNILLCEELIDLTDDKMYSFKKARNKERKARK